MCTNPSDVPLVNQLMGKNEMGGVGAFSDFNLLFILLQ